MAPVTHLDPTSFVLVSDLDDTLLGDDAALERFAAFHEAQRGALQLVYASGRFCASIQRSIDETDLPEPVATIGGVGSEIWHYPSRQPDAAWQQRIASHWSADTLRDILADEPGLTPQPGENQSDFKASYYLEGADAARIDALRSRVEAAGLEVRVIYSSNRDLDFLPRGADKGTAADFLTSVLGYPRGRVLSAGNSANDSSLMKHGFRGIVVANAHAELRELTRDPLVYQASQDYADGVREGIEHWFERDADA